MESKLWSRNFAIVISVTLLMYVAYNILIATLPLHIKNIGGSTTQIGLVVSAFAVAALLSRPFAGNILDNYPRKTVLLVSYGLITLISVGFALPLTTVPLLGLRFLHGLFWGICSTAIASLTSDVTPKHLSSDGWGYFIFAQSLAMAIGPIVGSVAMLRFDFPRTALSVVGLLILCCFLLRCVSYPKPDTDAPRQKTALSLRTVVEKKALFPALLSTLLMMTLGFVLAFIMIYGKQRGVHNAGLFFAGFTFTILVSRFLEKKLTRAGGTHVVLITGALAVILALFILSYAKGLGAIITAALFYGLGYGAISPVLLAWAVNASPKERIGATNATFLASLDIGLAIGASLFGWVSTHTGLAVAYRLCSLCMVVFLALYAAYHLKKRTPPLDRAWPPLVLRPR